MKNYLILILIVTTICACSPDPFISLTPLEFQKQIEYLDNEQIVDVRTEVQFWSGHITNAQNIDYTLQDFSEMTEQLIQSEPVFVYCELGGISQDAAKVLVEQGFREIYILDGGLSSWKRQGLPIEN